MTAVPPELKPGRDFRTVVTNSLRLMEAGLSKPEAIALAHLAAGYLPPKPSKLSTRRASSA